MCEASTGTRLRTFAQRGVALDQTRLWVSFALCQKTNKNSCQSGIHFHNNSLTQ